ncbi:MAG: hypothetical protein R3E48_21400 [Burkholderiaceae bacterium]
MSKQRSSDRSAMGREAPLAARPAPRWGRIATVATALLSGPAAHAIWVGDNTKPYEARAALAIQLDIGKFIHLQVGSAGSIVDTISFDLGQAVPAGPGALGFGTGVPIAAQGLGMLDVIVRSNSGTVSLSATNDGGGRGLSNGRGGYISYSQVITVSDDPGLPVPTLDDAPGSFVQVAPTDYDGRVTDRQARWQFRFANVSIPEPGQYRGQVTYTAAAP